MLGRPGANVTLLCREREPPNGTVLWSGRRRALGGGNALLLGGLRPEDAGRYSCHLGGHTLRTVRLLVEGGCVAVWVRVLSPPPPSPSGPPHSFCSTSLPHRAPRAPPRFLLPAQPRQRCALRVAAARIAGSGHASGAMDEAQVRVPPPISPSP